MTNKKDFFPKNYSRTRLNKQQQQQKKKNWLLNPFSTSIYFQLMTFLSYY